MQTAEAGLHTVADYMKLPDDGRRYELIEGELLMAPAPNRFHQKISFNLTLLLGAYVREHRLGEMYVAPFDVIFDEHNVLQPDIIYFSKSRASALTTGGATGVPDLAIEIVSPGAERRDRVLKRKIFAQSGVEELWLVLPETRQIEIYRFAEKREHPVERLVENGQFTSVMFPTLTIKAADVFSD